MSLTKDDVLRMMNEDQGKLTEHIFIEMGLVGVLEELIHDGCVQRVHVQNDFDIIELTVKGLNRSRSTLSSND